MSVIDLWSEPEAGRPRRFSPIDREADEAWGRSKATPPHPYQVGAGRSRPGRGRASRRPAHWVPTRGCWRSELVRDLVRRPEGPDSVQTRGASTRRAGQVGTAGRRYIATTDLRCSRSRTGSTRWTRPTRAPCTTSAAPCTAPRSAGMSSTSASRTRARRWSTCSC